MVTMSPALSANVETLGSLKEARLKARVKMVEYFRASAKAEPARLEDLLDSFHLPAIQSAEERINVLTALRALALRLRKEGFLEKSGKKFSAAYRRILPMDNLSVNNLGDIQLYFELRKPHFRDMLIRQVKATPPGNSLFAYHEAVAALGHEVVIDKLIMYASSFYLDELDHLSVEGYLTVQDPTKTTKKERCYIRTNQSIP